MRITQFTPVAGVGFDHRPAPTVIDMGTGTRLNKNVVSRRPAILAAFRWGDSMLSLTPKSFTLPSRALGDSEGGGDTIWCATTKLIEELGIVAAPTNAKILGRFSGVDHRSPPTYVVGCFFEGGGLPSIEKNINWLRRESVTTLTGNVPKELLGLLLTMGGGDEFGYGDEGLIIWPRESEEARIAA